ARHRSPKIWGRIPSTSLNSSWNWKKNSKSPSQMTKRRRSRLSGKRSNTSNGSWPRNRDQKSGVQRREWNCDPRPLTPCLGGVSQAMTRRVVITGMGTVNPLATEITPYWHALLEGRSGIGLIEQFDTTAFKVRFGGEVKG